MKNLILVLILLSSFSEKAFSSTFEDVLGVADDLMVDEGYVDIFRIETRDIQPGGAPHRFVVRSAAFDSIITLISPGRETWVNDDFEGSTSLSSLTVQLSQSSPWFLVVSSYNADGGGAYTLEVDPDVVLERQGAFDASVSYEFLQNTFASPEEQYEFALGGSEAAANTDTASTYEVFAASVEAEQAATQRVEYYERELERQSASAQAAQAELERYAEEQRILAAEARMPEFPWPPPHASAAQVLDRDILLNAVADTENVDLQDIDRLLSNSLSSVGYTDKSYYAVPKGFAIVTRLEQTDIDGVPLGALARWSTSIPVMESFSLRDYVRALFGANVGYFRILAFVVTSHTFAQADEEVNLETALAWVSDGNNAIPDTIRSVAFDEKYNVTVLVYEFEKLHSEEETEVKIPGRLSSQIHLQNSGFMNALEE